MRVNACVPAGCPPCLLPPGSSGADRRSCSAGVECGGVQHLPAPQWGGVSGRVLYRSEMVDSVCPGRGCSICEKTQIVFPLTPHVGVMTPQSISRILAKAGHVKTLGKQLTHQFRPGFAVFWSSDQISIRVDIVTGKQIGRASCRERVYGLV